MAPLVGTRVLVIGGTAGLGYGVAKVALAEGATVIVASTSPVKVASAQESLGGGERVLGEVVDVSKEDEVKALLERVGSVDHLVFTVSNSTLRVGGETMVDVCVAQAGEAVSPRNYDTFDLDTFKTFLDVRYWGVPCFLVGRNLL
jgi:NAD(P)-dependent dehydrogenase (short-subunit alcohol dehydrogenase family)